MNTKQDKKEKILRAINKIEEQNKALRQTLDKIYQEPNIKHELEFVGICGSIQGFAKEAIDETGYYKNLMCARRNVYAPEELEGDASALTDLVKVELDKVEEQIAEGNTAFPIKGPDTTKEDWLRCINDAQEYYAKTYREAKEYYDSPENKDNNVLIKPVKTNILFDEEIINAAAGFMPGPVGLFRNKCVAAETQKFVNLTEMQTFLINVQCKTKDMVLYMCYEQAGAYYFRGTFVDKE